jgi:lipoate-protein ligase A
MQAYRALCQFLIQGWRSLGVDLQYGQAGRGYIHNPNCFETATAADLVMADGCKLIGSAQLLRGQAVLQHGSIRLAPDAALFQQVFGVKPQLPHLPFHQSSDAVLAMVIQALVEAARECFAVELQLQPLSEAEWEKVLQASRGWRVQ